MKRIIALILALCLVSACLIGCSSTDEAVETPAPEATETPVAEAPEAAPAVEIDEIDFEKLYAAFDPEEVVMTVDGKDVTWAEYFYLVFANCQELMNYFSTMSAYYGVNMTWSDSMGEGYDYTYASYVPKSIENSLVQLITIEGNAAKEKVELTQEHLDAIAAQLQEDILYMCGEGATEEDFNEYLKNIYMPRKMYDDINKSNFLYQQAFTAKYGRDSE
ncbi:MAG: hypothetical protein IJ364_00425, partial [Oscillospiraceae bacterium]|nr:hypothetical protein [Oscillospiraceae bacterium]